MSLYIYEYNTWHYSIEYFISKQYLLQYLRMLQYQSIEIIYILLQYNTIGTNPGYNSANMFNNDVDVDTGCIGHEL